jgi:hypothetical protein
MSKRKSSSNDELEFKSQACFMILRLESRCDALQAAVCSLTKKACASDNPAKDLEKLSKDLNAELDDLTKAILQNKLERIEKDDPAFAADLARWQKRGDLPERFLS